MSFSYSPGTALRQWGPDTAFTIADALTGVFIAGATGSGKTNGPAKHLLLSYLKAGFGGLCLTVKPEEARYLNGLCREAGRERDVIIVRPGTGARFNFLEWEATRASGGAGLTINIVRLLDEIAGAVVTESGGDTDAGGGDARFFRDALRHLLMNLVDLCLLSGRPVSLPLMRLIVNTAALTRQEAKDEKWREASACGRVLTEAEEKCAEADADKRASLAECLNYFLNEYPGLSDRTRSVINLSFSMLVRPLLTPPMRELFSTDTVITPESCWESSAVIIVDLPIQEYRTAGKIAQLAWKYCFQTAVLRRAQAQTGTLRPCFLYADEFQHFATVFDAEYQATARSAGGATIYITQTREGLRLALGSDEAVDALLANLSTQIFCRSGSIDTNEYASRLLGSRYIDVDTTNVSQSLARQEEHGSMQGGSSTTQHLRRFVEEAEFAQLLKGGEANDYRVSCIVYKGGETFPDASGERVPWLRLTFNQRK